MAFKANHNIFSECFFYLIRSLCLSVILLLINDSWTFIYATYYVICTCYALILVNNISQMRTSQDITDQYRCISIIKGEMVFIPVTGRTLSKIHDPWVVFKKRRNDCQSSQGHIHNYNVHDVMDICFFLLSCSAFFPTS